MTNRWRKSWAKGHYISDDGQFTAQARPAGYYPSFGCRMARHYVIRYRGHETSIIGTATTLAEATRLYLPPVRQQGGRP